MLSLKNEDLDKELRGGFEPGIVSAIYGPAGSGKSLMCIMATVACAELGKKIIYIDTEGSFSL